MDSESVQQGTSGQGKSKAIVYEKIREEERIETELRCVVRIYARDFEACKNSFEEWAKNWE